MGKSIAIHSYKGGTGKTVIATNLAVTYAMKGFNVCLLDYDFRAPSLHILFNAKPSFWLNDFLEGKCNIADALVESGLAVLGKLFIGFANPSIDAMREMMVKNRTWEMEALHRILSAKTTVYRDLKIDYIIFDTSPGIHYSSINALAASDKIVLVLKMDEFDLEGTKNLIKGIYDILGRRTGILLNKVLTTTTQHKTGIKDEEERMTRNLENLDKAFNRPILGVIPCYCDILLSGGKSIYALEKQNHPFSKTLIKVAEELDKL